GNARLTPELEDKVRGSAVLILILSEGYLASEWCQRELKSFLADEGKRRQGGGARVFVVEYDRVKRPEALKDLLETRFWEPDPLTQKTRTLGFPKPDPADRR